MNFLRKKLIGLFMGITLATASLAGEQVVLKNDNVSTKNKVLDKVLVKKEEKDASGYAGIFPISSYQGKYYILFTQEGLSGKNFQNKKGKTHTYCDCGGRIEPGQSLKEASLRELYEETSRVYDFQKQSDKFARDCSFYYDGAKRFTGFCEVPFFARPAFLNAFKDARKEYDKPGADKDELRCFCEKTDALWIDIKDLNQAIRNTPDRNGNVDIKVTVLDDNNQVKTQDMLLRKEFLPILKKSERILLQYVNQNQPVQIPAAQNQNRIPIRSLGGIDTNNFTENTVVFIDLDILSKDAKTSDDILRLRTSVDQQKSKVVVLGITNKKDIMDRFSDKRMNLTINKFNDFDGQTFNNGACLFNQGVIRVSDLGNKAECMASFFGNQKQRMNFSPSRLVIVGKSGANLLDSAVSFANNNRIPVDAYEIPQ